VAASARTRIGLASVYVDMSCMVYDSQKLKSWVFQNCVLSALLYGGKWRCITPKRNDVQKTSESLTGALNPNFLNLTVNRDKFGF